MPEPLRGEVWLADLGVARGHEQGGTRPALVLSVDLFNRGPADLVIVLPFTSKAKGVRCHVVVDPPEAGLRQRSFIKCEDLRSIAKERLLERWGGVPSDTMAEVEDQVRILLGL